MRFVRNLVLGTSAAFATSPLLTTVFADEAAVAEVPPAAATATAATAEQIPRLIAQLSDTDGEVRRQASAKLVATGKGAIAALKEVARSGPLEARVRGVQVLRDIYIHGNLESGDEAEGALEELISESNPSVSSRAETVLTQNYDIREKRALAEIQRLGAIVTYAEDVFDPNGDVRDGRILQHIVLGKDWTAGNDGLKHIRRLSRLRMLYYVPASGVTEEALKDLTAAVPNLDVQRRGPSCLGVSGMNDINGRGCYVGKVVENSAAAKAKIQPNDVIVSFDGKPVIDFKSLIELIETTKPGDKVKVEVVRDFQKMTLEPVMEHWKK